MKKKALCMFMSLFMAGTMTLSSVPFSAKMVFATGTESGYEETDVSAWENRDSQESEDISETTANVEDATGAEELSSVAREEITGAEYTSDTSSEALLSGNTGDETDESNLVGVTAAQDTFVLMNIPYGEFYAAEGDDAVDAVSSATKNKPRTIGLSGGSYHVDPEGTDITGIIYPVKVKSADVSALDALTEITDANSVSITVTNRGQTTTSTYTGRQALYEAPSYSYYALAEEPTSYKELTVDNGEFTFGPATGTPETVEGAFASQTTFFARHADIEIKLSGITVPAAAEGGDTVYTSGVVVTDEDGNMYALRHIANLWRGTEIGWNFDDAKFETLTGKKITNLRYFFSNGQIIDYPVEIDTQAYLLMNIPYGEFYAAEGDAEVDAVSSATKNKPRTMGLSGGSYHVDPEGTDITGIIYPVAPDAASLAALKAMKSGDEPLIKVITDNSSVDITVTNRGQTTTSTYTGRQALYEAPSYSFYTLSSEPASYKEMTANEEGGFSFAKATGEPSTVEGLTGSVKLNARHANVEIKLTGVEIPQAAEGEDVINVSGIIVTDEDGNQYALRHIANMWRGTEIGWNYDDAKYGALTGKTITNLRYYISNGQITDYPCEITYKVAKYNEDITNHALVTADDQTADQFATYMSGITAVTVNGTEYDNKETGIIQTTDALDEEGNVTVAAGTINLNAEKDGRKIFGGDEKYELTVTATAHEDYTFTLVGPDVTAGGNAKIPVGYDGTLEISTNGLAEHFRMVRVDGKELAGTDYSAETEKPAVSITNAFLSRLETGKHDVELVYANGIARTTLTITPILVTSIKLNKSSATLLKGKTLKLTPTVLPANATDQSVTWKSANTAVATVDANGKVSARKTGTARITATTKDGRKTAVCTVKVYERIPVYRFYNRKTGDHMYTTSGGERQSLIKAGWKDEGIACHVPRTSSKPVNRLYNKSNGDHMFTTSAGERKAMIAAGWIYEGIAFYSNTENKIPMYRLYNPNAKSGYHFFTGSKKERDILLNAGWKNEKVGFYGN